MEIQRAQRFLKYALCTPWLSGILSAAIMPKKCFAKFCQVSRRVYIIVTFLKACL
jgi:hypothetical protein